MKNEEFGSLDEGDQGKNKKSGGKKVIIISIAIFSVIVITLMIFGLSYLNKENEIKQADAFVLLEKYEDGINIYDHLLSKKYSRTIMNKRTLAMELLESAENLEKGLEASEENDINKAIRYLSRVQKDDKKRYELALEELANIEKTILIDIEQLIENGAFDQASEIVNTYLKADANNIKVQNAKESIAAKKSEIEEQIKVEEENKVEEQKIVADQAIKEAERVVIETNKNEDTRRTADSIVGTYKSIIASQANMRDAPTLNSGIVTVLYSGAGVYIHDTQIESSERIWCYVSTEENGYTDYGWISYNTMNYNIK